MARRRDQSEQLSAKMDKTEPPRARLPRGFQDRIEQDVAAEEAIVAAATAVYSAWGFARLDTPAIEFTDALGKFLPDVDRPNEGVFSFRDDDDQWVSLRYDLTAPLARYVAENWNNLPKPFRRWQAGPVWRNEKPGPGRFRQFTQCDADTVGAPGPGADAEMIMMASEAIAAAGVDRADCAIKINTRKALNGLLDLIGADAPGARLGVLRAVDKLDRLGEGGVAQLLGEGRKDESGDFTKGAGLAPASIDRVLKFIGAGRGDRRRTLAALESAIGESEAGRQGLAELGEIDRILDICGFPAARAAFDPSIVRGLEYYTGPVFEAHVSARDPQTAKPISFGSVGGGGRYDDLVSRFRGETVPATGFSIGVSRLAAVLQAARGPQANVGAGPVVILAFEPDRMPDYQAMAAELRAAGVRCEVYLGAAGMKAQMKYADRRRAPAVVIQGPDEREKDEVTIKDLALGAALAAKVADNAEWRSSQPAQFSAPRADLVARIREVLARH
jgi:histidyl-tRNA synthetase